MVRNRIITLPTPMIRKQAGQMRKLLGLWDNSKKDKTDFMSKVNPQPIVTDGKPIFLTQEKGIQTTHITRRQMVLNRHFTEIISDELATNMKMQISDLGVNITSIETKAWNKGVSIFYYTRKPFNKDTHLELNSLVKDLRYALSQLRPMGRVPHINFVYDDSARIDQDLQVALCKVNLVENEETKDVIETTLNEISSSKYNNINSEHNLDTKKFTSPSDMDNTALGLNYPALYDEISAKMTRGRAESSRMIPQTSLSGPSTPFIRGPIYEIEDNDTINRVRQMRNFIVRQRKKAEYHAKVRRKEELLQRDKVRWEIPDEEERESVIELNDFDEEENKLI